ncbi:MAG TPA: hypothetical protein VK157_12515 [Phycisphaerales bacterium]|nr:hypothetical protein [Phycisphaerales bacterium]
MAQAKSGVLHFAFGGVVFMYAHIASAQYTFTSLGQYGPSTATRAFAVTETGLVAGIAGSTVFRWTPAGFVTVAGASSVRDMSADGSVMVGPAGRWSALTGAWQPLLAATCIDMCPPNGCTWCGEVRAVNAVSPDGLLIVGEADNTPIAGEGRPAYWYTWSSNALLFPTGCTDSYYNSVRRFTATCVSPDARYVGGSDYGLHITIGCGGGRVWDNQTGTVASPAGFAGEFGVVNGISADGQVFAGVGSIGVPLFGPYGAVARRVTRAGVEEIIAGDNPPTGAYVPVVTGMSADASRIVGYRKAGSNEYSAWIWLQGRGTTDLRQFLIARGVNMTGWTLNSVRDISRNGRFLCGDGIAPDGRTTAWLIELPDDARCDSIDFNANSVYPEDQDVIDFFHVLAGGTCPTCNDIDFNNNGVFPEDQDVIDFFNVLAGGAC